MIKKTLYFGNPTYLSMKNAQLVISCQSYVKDTILKEIATFAFMRINNSNYATINYSE